MSTRFDEFYENSNYIGHKRLLFNYLLRKTIVQRYLRGSDPPILDVGSGIAPMVPNPSGVVLSDMSTPGMRIMRREGYDCAVLDLEGLGLRSDSVQAIVCSEVLEHVRDDENALRELSRVLAPGGRLILTVPLHDFYWGRDDRIVGHFRRYQPCGLVGRLERLGLRVVRIQPVGSPAERALTLASVLLFLKFDKGGAAWRRPPGRWFAVANTVVAWSLRLCAQLSPLAVSSIGLFECMKESCQEPKASETGGVSGRVAG